MAVVDDHPLFRDGVANTLAAAAMIEVVAQGASAAEALTIAADHLPDVMLLDVSMPGGGIEAAKTLSKAFPAVKVIILTVSESDEHFSAALENGARGYVLKGVSGPELINTVNAIQRGEQYVTPGLAARLLTRLKQDPPRRAPGEPDDALSELTTREYQILEKVSRGLTNKEIAAAFQISEKTVKHYMSNIMQKLHVRNRVEALLKLKAKQAG